MLAAFLVVLVPLGGFAQSIIWQTEIAGQQRTVEIIDNALHVVPAKSAASQWQRGKATPLGTVTAADKNGALVTLPAGKNVREAIESALTAGALEAAPVFREKSRGRSGNARQPRRYLPHASDPGRGQR